MTLVWICSGPSPVGLTYNTESIYATAHTDLKKDGPTVIETPPNVLGIVHDGWQRWITDLGNAGPDKGKGGKYLLLPPGYKDALWIDARTLFHYEAIVVTPAMKTKRESRFRGTSSQHHTGD